jgi:hypothetical protein
MATHPEIALKPDVSLVVIVHGMAKGGFTGKKLGDYITDFDHKVCSLKFPLEGPPKGETYTGLHQCPPYRQRS